MEDFNLYVLPISGGGFPVQMGFIGDVSKAKISAGIKYKPDVVFAASGGNIATYIAMASNWNTENMKNISENLETEQFARNWWPDYMSILPSWLLAPWNGSMFRQGHGTSIEFKSLFNQSSIQNVEIWSGTFDQKHRKAQFFCNKREDSSVILNSNFDNVRFMKYSMPLKYLDGNLDKIAKVLAASASIPVLIESQIIDDIPYSDGGTIYASPLTPLSGEIMRYVQGKVNVPEFSADMSGITGPTIYSGIDGGLLKIPTSAVFATKKLKIIYFASFDMFHNIKSENNISITKNVTDTVGMLVDSLCSQDVNIAIEMMTMMNGGDHSSLGYKFFPDSNVDTLTSIFKNSVCYNNYLIIIYPIKTIKVEKTNFKGADINKIIDKSVEKYQIQLYYN